MIGCGAHPGVKGSSYLPWVHERGPLSAYLKDRYITLTGGKISTWGDATAHGRDLLQANDTLRPIPTVNGGKINFTDKLMQSAAFASVNGPFTGLVSFEYIASGNDVGLFSLSSTDSANLGPPRVHIRPAAASDLFARAGNAISTYKPASLVGVAWLVANGASSRVGLNYAGSAAFGSAFTDIAERICLGGLRGGYAFSGYIHDALFFGSAFDDAALRRSVDWMLRRM